MMKSTDKFPQITLEDKEKTEVFCNSDGLALQSLYFAQYKEFPSLLSFCTEPAYTSYYFDTKALVDAIPEIYKGENFQTVFFTLKNIQTDKETVGINIIFPDKHLYARIETNPAESYILYQNGREDEVERFYKEVMKFYQKTENKPNNVYAIAYDNGYYLTQLPTKDYSKLDISKNYNDDFLAEHENIKSFIEQDDESGLLILHGEKGTGKSTYIRHLISVNPGKRFVYIPSNLIKILGQPNFSSYLLTLQNHIIILEDCEGAIKDRHANGSPEAVSLLLNLTDGLLSDGLGLKFICTFNDDVKNIDSALLRKGRLVSKYEFTPLSADKANGLLSELWDKKWSKDEKLSGEIPPQTNKPLSLANIYNFYKKSYENDRKKII